MKNNKMESKIEVSHELLRVILSDCNAENEDNKDNKNMDDGNITNIIGYAMKSMKKEMTLDDIYNYLSDYCATKISTHPKFNKLASRLCVKNLHRKTDTCFKTVVGRLNENIDKTGNHTPLISKELHDTVEKHHDIIQSKLDFTRDFYFDYFGMRTLERSYLYKLHYYECDGKIIRSGQIIERPQHMIMRVALGIHKDNLEGAFVTYDLMSNKYMTHATPTLFNSGSIRPQMSSCFLFYMKDSIEGIFKECISDVAKVSKWAGGIGITLSEIRGKGSLIRKTNGTSDGLIPLCRVLNMIARYVNQGGKRNGSIAVYLEPWHSDIFEFCELRTNTGNESDKARDLFLALWVCDIFMKRVKNNEMWSLMCPDECPGLTNCYGEEFEKLYVRYEEEKKYKKQIPAVKLWYHIMSCQIETGMPYMLYKDNVNKKSNQKNIGVIKSSNLCSEIVEYTDENNTAVCNLASICLPKFIEQGPNNAKCFNFCKLQAVAEILTENLDLIIDNNFYPTENTEASNNRYRPIGVGVQGLADVYNIMGYPFESKEAKKLNEYIFETIYFGCMTKSNSLAKTKGKYSAFDGSPASMGELQFSMWGKQTSELSGRYDWDGLMLSIRRYGLRNSLTTTAMPTASTSQIMGNSEGIEPYMSNVYTRSTLAGDFIVINENLVRDLISANVWNEGVRKKIIIMNGSVQDIPGIPKHIKDIYKTCFEIKLKSVISQSLDRAIFIDQSQSLNLYMDTSDFDKLTSAHFYGWENGIKTGMYYLRSRPAVDPIQFGIDAKEIMDIKQAQQKLHKIGKSDGSGECLMCSG